jgi:CxxC-x17-CxxC domain-containing protein
MNVSYVDKILTCRDCGQEFVWTAGEQAFYASKNLVNQPSRCPSCRAAARSARESTGMSHSARPREFFPAVCDQCGVQTQVPFLPRNDRPVYCSACYDVIRASGAASAQTLRAT